jgi:hypothetical protein
VFQKEGIELGTGGINPFDVKIINEDKTMAIIRSL